MVYRITKECGAGWGDEPKAVPAWGVSESQIRRAEKVAPGDIFLHYIDFAHAWSGYSSVTGSLVKNDRDFHADWLAALPFVIPIECSVMLNKGQCERTVSVPGLCEKHYWRQVAFTVIPQTEAELIMKAIDDANSVRSIASSGFCELWEIGAESYYKGIVKSSANGKCWLCKEDVNSWVNRVNVSMTEIELESICDAFLDAAHIVPDCALGPMTPDNLRPLCPTCHRIVDRLSDERREELLRKSTLP